MADNLVEQLNALDAKATPGPWNVFYYDAGDRRYYDNCPSIQAPESEDCAVIHWDGFKQEYWTSANGDQRQIDANAALIVALRNEALPRLTQLTAERDALAAKCEALAGAGIDVAASLAAAISLLEKGGKAAKKAAPSDRMFDQMLADYRKSLDRARAALAAYKGDAG